MTSEERGAEHRACFTQGNPDTARARIAHTVYICRRSVPRSGSYLTPNPITPNRPEPSAGDGRLPTNGESSGARQAEPGQKTHAQVPASACSGLLRSCPPCQVGVGSAARCSAGGEWCSSTVSCRVRRGVVAAGQRRAAAPQREEVPHGNGCSETTKRHLVLLFIYSHTSRCLLPCCGVDVEGGRRHVAYVSGLRVAAKTERTTCAELLVVQKCGAASKPRDESNRGSRRARRFT